MRVEFSMIDFVHWSDWCIDVDLRQNALNDVNSVQVII